MFPISNKDICLYHTFLRVPEEFVYLGGTGKTVDMPIKSGLGEALLVVNTENVPQGEKARAGRHKKGKRETAYRKDKAQTHKQNQAKYVHYFPILTLF